MSTTASLCELSERHEDIAVRFLLRRSHLESRQHLVGLLIGTGENGVPGVAVGVNYCVSFLPADDDGPLSPGRAVQLLQVTLLRHGGVGVTGDHSRDWKDGERDEKREGENKMWQMVTEKPIDEGDMR